MTKQRQRERARQRQHAAQQASHRGDAVGEGPSDAELLRIVEAVFRLSGADRAAAETGVSVEEATEVSWTMFEHGLLRLIKSEDEERCGMELVDGRGQQRRQARMNRPLVELRRQQMAADGSKRLGEKAVESGEASP